MIVLDTHAWVWYVDSPEQLSEPALKVIDTAKEEGSIYISCISTWEILMLSRKERLAFSVETATWISRCERLPFFHFVPVDNSIIDLSAKLDPGILKDPADRFIAATAGYMGSPLVTKDRAMTAIENIEVVW